VIDRTEAESLAAVHGDFGYPAVVKPVSEGSSVGVEIAGSFEELAEAVERALVFDSHVMVERFVSGQEISVGVLGDRSLGAVEVSCADGFYDFTAKYTPGATRYHIPPRLTPARYRGVLNQGLRAHRALACSGATRVDLIVSDTGNEYILEVNTLPGLTRTSLLPKIADNAGLSFEDLVEAILLGADLSGVDRGHGDRRIALREARSWEGEERRAAAVEPH
jgi:D-alanine-D-alanine ligase